MWRGFSWREHFLALRAGLLASLLVPLLRASSLQFCLRLLQGLQSPVRGGSGSCVPAAQVHRLADVIAFGCSRYALFSPACLARSLSLQHLLARRGIKASLRLGSRILEGEFSAHAWVEYRGLPLAEAQAPRELYAPFEPGCITAGRIPTG